MNLEKGFIATIKSGWDIGLDVPAGEIEVLAVETYEQNKNLKDDIKIFIQPYMLSAKDMVNYSISYIELSLDYILEIRKGNWVTFRYTNEEIDEITIPEIEFLRLLNEKVLDDLIDSL